MKKTWWCCGVKRPIDQSCSCGERYDASTPARLTTHGTGRVFNKYCCVVVEGKLDSATFPNPQIDPEAVGRCIERANFLRHLGKSCYPALITQLKED